MRLAGGAQIQREALQACAQSESSGAARATNTHDSVTAGRARPRRACVRAGVLFDSVRVWCAQAARRGRVELSDAV